MERRFRILTALGKSEDGLTITELVGKVGVSDGIVRNELTRLSAAGVVQSRLERPKTPGRPHHRYTLTEGPSGAYVQLVGLLLDLIDDDSGGGGIAEAAHRYGARSVSGTFPDGVITQAAESGFDPHEVTSPEDALAGTTRVRLRTCPVSAAVLADDGHRLCVLHEEIVRGRCAALGGRLVEFTPDHPYAGHSEFVAAAKIDADSAT
jgi:predicted ArsR family transcriptional regulator